MGLSQDDYKLKPCDAVSYVEGKLVVERTVTLALCRCRECKDQCPRLSGYGYVLCNICNNNHTQKADLSKYSSEWLGPHTGPRPPGDE